MENEKYYMECGKCGHRWTGSLEEKCPECGSKETEPTDCDGGW